MINAVKHLVEIVEEKSKDKHEAQQISNNPGAHKHKDKVGRGSSSGLGKTSGRGVKGAKARTGTKVYGFEGGQMPLHMRMPKRGFNNIFANDFSEVNLGRIQKAIDDKRLKNAARSPKRFCARPAWRTRAATACACWARARSPPRSTSKWRAFRRAPGRRSKRPAAASPPPSRRRSTQQEGRARQAPEAPHRRRRKSARPARLN